MKKEKSLLLIIDPLNKFKNEHTKNVLKKIEEEIIPEFDDIWVAKFFNKKNSLFKTIRHWDRCDKNSSEDRKLAIKIPKGKQVVFYETDKYNKLTPKLKRYISKKSVKVYICGVDTDMCVSSTAFAMWDSKIAPFIIEDACASHGGDNLHSQGIKTMIRAFGKNQIVKSSDLKQGPKI